MVISANRILLKDLERAIDALPQRSKQRLMKRLERQAWGPRIDKLLARIDARVKRKPISQQQVSVLIEQVRRELYAERSR